LKLKNPIEIPSTTNTYNMSSIQTIPFYFKVPFTEIRCSYKFPKNITIAQFLEQVNKDIRSMLNIHSKYYIEVVEANTDKGEYGEALLPNNSQTLQHRYGNLGVDISFYIRPVDPITKIFTRQISYAEHFIE
jgi:hypothetical protein